MKGNLEMVKSVIFSSSDIEQLRIMARAKGVAGNAFIRLLLRDEWRKFNKGAKKMSRLIDSIKAIPTSRIRADMELKEIFDYLRNIFDVKEGGGNAPQQKGGAPHE